MEQTKSLKDVAATIAKSIEVKRGELSCLEDLHAKLTGQKKEPQVDYAAECVRLTHHINVLRIRDHHIRAQVNGLSEQVKHLRQYKTLYEGLMLSINATLFSTKGMEMEVERCMQPDIPFIGEFPEQGDLKGSGNFSDWHRYPESISGPSPSEEVERAKVDEAYEMGKRLAEQVAYGFRTEG